MTGISTLKNVNLVLSFLLELGLLAAFGIWGFHTGQTQTAKFLLGGGAALLVAIFWGLFMAPRSSMRVQKPLYPVFKVLLFSLAVIALAAAGRPTLAWVMGGLSVVNNLIDLI